MKQARPYPQVVVTRKAARSLKAGHPWVFEGEVVRMEPAADGTAISNIGRHMDKDAVAAKLDELLTTWKRQ